MLMDTPSQTDTLVQVMIISISHPLLSGSVDTVSQKTTQL